MRGHSAAAIIAALLLAGTAAAAYAQLAVSANDAKVKLVDGKAEVQKGGQADTVAIIDMRPSQPKLLAEIEVPNSVVGPPLNVAVSPKEEFALDFMNIMPPQGALVARIFTSPGHAKRILKALEENIGNYEKQFGKIDIAEEPKGGIGFQG